MESKKTIQLIQGQFTPDEAYDVLLSLINHKINFHELKNFGSQERNGFPDTTSLQRIKELKQARQELERLIKESRDGEYMLKVSSAVELVLQPSMVRQY